MNEHFLLRFPSADAYLVVASAADPASVRSAAKIAKKIPPNANCVVAVNKHDLSKNH